MAVSGINCEYGTLVFLLENKINFSLKKTDHHCYTMIVDQAEWFKEYSTLLFPPDYLK